MQPISHSLYSRIGDGIKRNALEDGNYITLEYLVVGQLYFYYHYNLMSGKEKE